jgi:NitT/TauT family transport system permease protein
MNSWFLDWLRRSEIIEWVGAQLGRLGRSWAARSASLEAGGQKPRPGGTRMSQAISLALFAGLVGALLYGVVRLVTILGGVPGSNWKPILVGASLTLGRVLLSTALGTLWALPAGLAIGLSPRLSRLLQPVVQVVASFPAPMLFPAVIAALRAAGVTLGWGSVVLMLLGTQWYILFNVIAGAMAVPADLREAARSYRLRRFHRFTALYFPAVFPYLVTGWITAAGGAWNASIVAEYVTFRGEILSTRGLGAQISLAAASANFPVLAASVVVMSIVVVAFNRFVWRRLQGLAETRFSLSK